MKLADRIEAFIRLGELTRQLGLNERRQMASKARDENPWFTEDNVQLALKGIEVLLEPENLRAWIDRYKPEPKSPKLVGVAMAGNIPLVGFHDFLCVLISGHLLAIKPSREDSTLLQHLFRKLVAIEPRFDECVAFVDRLKDMQAVIATGSDNTARYFEYYFRDVPLILRRNRTSCAIIQGDEVTEDLALLGTDVFSYFGLGCRNVSKLFVPAGYDLRQLAESWKDFEKLVDHHKYAHNYDYHKAIFHVNHDAFVDSGFVLMKESPKLASPVSVIYYESYSTQKDAQEKIGRHADKLQLVGSARGWYPGSIPFGNAQLPGVGDYADGVDTMKFLVELR